MIMKRFVLTAVVAVLAVITAGAQTAGGKKPSKQERKAMQARIDSLMNLKAQSAINDTAFVIEADEVTFKRGYTVHVTSNTNFIAFCGDKAVVQVAFNVPWPGFNGLGGITLEGSVSGYKKTTDKKGNIYIQANVNGVGISAQVFITLWNGGNQATASIQQNFRSGRITLDGDTVPLEESNIFQGTAI